MKRLLPLILVLGVIAAGVSLYRSYRSKVDARDSAAWERAKAERAAELTQAQKHKPTPQPVLPRALPSAEDTQPTKRSEPKTIEPQPPPVEDPVAKPLPVPVPDTGGLEVTAALAREALSFVGIDLRAEEVWAEAINNPELSAKVRQNLIEDLNEDGFPDPKNITIEDLPLILNRIELIEEYAPLAMDDVNAAAFMEAYRDLIKMYSRANGF